MKYILDTHTHSIAGGHAYNTLFENIKEASEKGVKVLANTEHGPQMPGGPHLFYFSNFKVLPRKLYGVTLLHGCEANIIDFDGNIDIPERIQVKMDIIIASLHDVCIKPGNIEENTRAVLKVMDNPNVDIIGHLGNPAFPIFAEEIVKKAKEKNKIIEVNNSSLASTGSRAGSKENCYKIAELCKVHEVKISIGSDAHTCLHIGEFAKAEKLLEDIDMPKELIMNTDEVKIVKYLKEKGRLKDLVLD